MLTGKTRNMVWNSIYTFVVPATNASVSNREMVYSYIQEQKRWLFLGTKKPNSVTSYILIEPELPTQLIYFKCGCPI